MMRVLDVSSKSVEANVVFPYEGFQVSCTTILSKVPELRVFNPQRQDVTERVLPLENGPIMATAANLVKAFAGINYYLLVTR